MPPWSRLVARMWACVWSGGRKKSNAHMLTHKDHTLHINDFGIDMCHRTDLMWQNYRKERTTNTTQTAEKFSKASHGTHVAVAYSTQRNDSPPHAIWDWCEVLFSFCGVFMYWREREREGQKERGRERERETADKNKKHVARENLRTWKGQEGRRRGKESGSLLGRRPLHLERILLRKRQRMRTARLLSGSRSQPALNYFLASKRLTSVKQINLRTDRHHEHSHAHTKLTHKQSTYRNNMHAHLRQLSACS